MDLSQSDGSAISDGSPGLDGDLRTAFVCVDQSLRVVYAHGHADLFGPDFGSASAGRHLPEVLPEPLNRDVLGMLQTQRSLAKTVQQIDGRTYTTTALRGPDAALVFWHEMVGEHSPEVARQIVSDFGTSLASSLDYDATLETVVQAALPTLGDLAILDVMVSENLLRRITWAHVDPVEKLHVDPILSHQTDHQFDQNPVYEALIREQITNVPNADEAWIQASANSPEHAQFFRELHFRSLIVVPLLAHGRIVAVLNFCSSKPYYYDDNLLRLAEDYGKMAALAVDNAILYRAAQDEIERRQATEKVLDNALRRLNTHIENTAMAVIEWQPDFRVRMWSDRAAQVFGWSREEVVGKRPSEWPYMDREDADSMQWAVGRVLSQQDSYGSAISRTRNKAGAELQCEWHTSATIGDSGETLLVSFVQDVTDRIRVETELQVRLNEETLMNRINLAILRTDDATEIELEAINALGEMLHPDRCFFIRFDNKHGTVTIEDEWRRVDLSPIRGTHSMTAFGVDSSELYVDQKTLVVSDIESGAFAEAAVQLMNNTGVRSILSVPFFDKHGLSATLTLCMENPRNWQPREAALAEAVAVTVRTAVESANLRRREHKIATILQDALQPSEPDKIPGMSLGTYYKPALDEASIGGDFFDIFEISAGRYALVIGDVSGKGLTAAAQVSLVRNMLRCMLYQERPLKETTAELNRLLTEHNLLKGFVTVAVCVYELRTKSFQFVSCGHETLLLRKGSDGVVFELQPTGPPLGIARDSVYDEYAYSIAEGDLLLMCTDGITEAGTDRANMLGIQGLISLAMQPLESDDAQLLTLHFMRQVEQFAGGTLSDDACLITALLQSR